MSNYGDQAQPALLNAFLLSTKDALMVFEAARRGICPVVTRRLHDSEKTSLVVSGSVFAFDEHATGIKRWTDGTLWSPSRIIGNYLVYRELEKKGNKTAKGVETPTNEPTSATHEASGLAGGCAVGIPEPTSQNFTQTDPFDQRPGTATSQSHMVDLASSSDGATALSGATGLQRDVERALIGSLTTSYKFKKGGLVKKTISNGSLHLICYYSIEDVVAGRLRAPSSLMELASLEISSSLLDRKNFRLPPLTELDSIGELRYVGEEADPASNPGTIGPLVSPTVGSRPLDTLHLSSDSQAPGAMFEAAPIMNPGEFHDERQSQDMSTGHPSAHLHQRHDPLSTSAHMPSFQPGPPLFAQSPSMPQEHPPSSLSQQLEQRESPAALYTYPASMPQTSFLQDHPPPFRYDLQGTRQTGYLGQEHEQHAGRLTPQFRHSTTSARPLSSSAIASSSLPRSHDLLYGTSGASLSGSTATAIPQQRSLIARTAPQARSVYSARPYDRRPSEPGTLMGHFAARPTSSPVVYTSPHPFKLSANPGEAGPERQTYPERPPPAFQPMPHEPLRSVITSPPPLPSHMSMPTSQLGHPTLSWQYSPGHAPSSPYPQPGSGPSALQPHEMRYEEALPRAYHDGEQVPQGLERLQYRSQQESPAPYHSSQPYSQPNVKLEEGTKPYYSGQPEPPREDRSPSGWQEPDPQRERASYHFRSETFPQAAHAQAQYTPPGNLILRDVPLPPAMPMEAPHSAPAASYEQFGVSPLQHQQQEALRAYPQHEAQPQWTANYNPYKQQDQLQAQPQQHFQQSHQDLGPPVRAPDRYEMVPGQTGAR